MRECVNRLMLRAELFITSRAVDNRIIRSFHSTSRISRVLDNGISCFMSQLIDRRFNTANFCATSGNGTVHHGIVRTTGCTSCFNIIFNNCFTVLVAACLHSLGFTADFRITYCAIHYGIIRTGSGTGSTHVIFGYRCTGSMILCRNGCCCTPNLTFTYSTVHYSIVRAGSSTSGINVIFNHGLSLGMAERIAFSYITYGASLSSSAVCVCPLMSECFTLSFVTHGAYLGSSTSRVCPIMSKSFALGCATSFTRLCSCAVRVCPIMSKRLALGCTTYGTRLGGIAICIYPRVSKSVALGCTTYGTRLGGIAISIYPRVSKSCALSFSTHRTCLGSCTVCICPCVAKCCAFGFSTYRASLSCIAICIYPCMSGGFICNFFAADLDSAGRAFNDQNMGTILSTSRSYRFLSFFHAGRMLKITGLEGFGAHRTAIFTDLVINRLFSTSSIAFFIVFRYKLFKHVVLAQTTATNIANTVNRICVSMRSGRITGINLKRFAICPSTSIRPILRLFTRTNQRFRLIPIIIRNSLSIDFTLNFEALIFTGTKGIIHISSICGNACEEAYKTNSGRFINIAGGIVSNFIQFHKRMLLLGIFVFEFSGSFEHLINTNRSV